jgi:hypothetical protein
MRGSTQLAILCAVVLGATGCANVEKDWQTTKQADTARSYEEFLARHRGSPHDAEARQALTEYVLLPYGGYVGSASDMPALENLKVPAALMSEPVASVLDNPSFHMNGTFGGMMLNGHWIELSNPAYDGQKVETTRFGTLRCTFAQGQPGRSGSMMMVFYLAGTRAQRDSILAFVQGAPTAAASK